MPANSLKLKSLRATLFSAARLSRQDGDPPFLRSLTKGGKKRSPKMYATHHPPCSGVFLPRTLPRYPVESRLLLLPFCIQEAPSSRGNLALYLRSTGASELAIPSPIRSRSPRNHTRPHQKRTFSMAKKNRGVKNGNFPNRFTRDQPNPTETYTFIEFSSFSAPPMVYGVRPIGLAPKSENSSLTAGLRCACDKILGDRRTRAEKQFSLYPVQSAGI